MVDIEDRHFSYLKKIKPTTAIYPNRIREKHKIEKLFDLGEHGNDSTKFHSTKGTLIFQGYVRVVYGDHGPYVEFTKEQLRCEPIKKFNRNVPFNAYYEWQTLDDGSDVKIYWQLKDVHNLPNPPAGGFKGNRVEGYADYKPGMYYISPYELKVVK